MGYGVELVVASAYLVQNWDGGVIQTAASPGRVVGAFMLGGLVICALRGWLRSLDLVAVAAAILGLSVVPPPDILVDEQGRTAAVRDGDTLYFTSIRRGAFKQKV